MKTDRQTDKSTRWAFTAFEEQWSLFKEQPPIVKEWGYQTEVCPTTGKKHYQGYILTYNQQRFSALKKVFPNVHLEVARDWNALLNYCKKTETAVAGTQVKKVNERRYLKFSDALVRIASAYISRSEEQTDLLKTDPHNAPAWCEKSLDEIEKEQFSKAVSDLVMETPEDISLYTNPQIYRAWVMCKGIWLQMAQCALDICPHNCRCNSSTFEYDEDLEVRNLLAEEFFSTYSIAVE